MKIAWFALLAALGYVTAPVPDYESAILERRDGLVSGTRRWLDGLTAEQRTAATFDFTDPQRLDWHFIPRDRKGLSFAAMDETQRTAADTYLRTLLPPIVHQTVRRVIDLENVLHEIEGSDVRDPLRYYFSVFGAPDAVQPFAVRFEGHHVAINLTQRGARASWTPFFLGANPATVRDGKHVARGERVLGFITDEVVSILERLSPELREKARLGPDVPGDVLFVPGTTIPADLGAGIPLHWRIRAELAALIDPFANYVDPSRLPGSLGTMIDDDTDRLVFAGSTEPGKPLYLRIVYRGLVIEYANVQNGANHVHLLIRDRDDDFGARMLGEHVKSEAK